MDAADSGSDLPRSDPKIRRGGRTISLFTLLVEHPSFDNDTSSAKANAPGVATGSDARSIIEP
ncbi:hypothetical protein C8R45DRAFT_1094621 [Mycena sanguinolenta]|nr:hypothetical protein C8R45DRAFT_1094621 [Mycena sanguinolenta]